ncbi:MAG: GGDEF domain-containing protein [Woeseiaceae bacterium]
MDAVSHDILEQVIGASSEPLMIVCLDHTDWPVSRANPAFEVVGGTGATGRPFAEVIEELVGRELALEISESLRAQQETSFPVEINGREYLLALKPLAAEDGGAYVAIFWRGSTNSVAAAVDEAHHALLKAKRKVRDLSRDDAVTGLLNSRAFGEVLEHDWAVAARENSTLALVLFTLDDFDTYVEVFGKHASDSCLRRVGQTIRRCLRRASDVVARLDGARLIVLSHASDEDGVRAFAGQIATAVRELGLHHPRSESGRFVTVTHRVRAITVGKTAGSAKTFLADLLRDG